MARKIVVTLTEAEARELLLTAMSGYADGDFYSTNNPEHEKPNLRGVAAYDRAIKKLQDARHKGA